MSSDRGDNLEHEENEEGEGSEDADTSESSSIDLTDSLEDQLDDPSDSTSVTTSSTSSGPLPKDDEFEDELLEQRPLDIRMFIFDTEMQRDPLSPAEHAHMDDRGTGDDDPWHAFELPLAQDMYDKCFFSEPQEDSGNAPARAHYANVLQRALENLTHVRRPKVVSCSTEPMQRTLTKYVKLIVRYKTRPFFFVKPSEHKDCTMMHIPVRCKDAIMSALPSIEILTGTVSFLCDGPEVDVRDASGKWRKGRIDRWLHQDLLAIVVGKATADVVVEDVRSIHRDDDDALPLAIFASEERKRLRCMAQILRIVADIVNKLPTNCMFHPMISVRQYSMDDERLLQSIAQKFELPLRAATNCSILIAQSHNIAILVGTAAEKQLCAAYIQCMTDFDVPSRSDALLIPRPDAFQSKMDDLISVGEATKTLVFVKGDKIVVMSPSFIRRAHAFLKIAHHLDEIEPGYIQSLHVPVDSCGLYKVTEIVSQYDHTYNSHRRLIYESKMNHIGVATGGAVAIMRGSIYAIGTDEAIDNITLYTRWFFMNPSSDRGGPCGKDTICVSVDANVEIAQCYFDFLAHSFKVYAIPYPGMERARTHVQNIWLCGPNRALKSAATALCWLVQNPDLCPDATLQQPSIYPHRPKKPTIHTASAQSEYELAEKKASEPIRVALATALPPPAQTAPVPAMMPSMMMPPLMPQMMPQMMPPLMMQQPMMSMMPQQMNPMMSSMLAMMDAKRRCL